MIDHVCTGPHCLPCVEQALYVGVFAPREEEERELLEDEALERALGEISEESRLVAEGEREDE
jgi:hypothetical protein